MSVCLMCAYHSTAHYRYYRNYCPSCVRCRKHNAGRCASAPYGAAAMRQLRPDQRGRNRLKVRLCRTCLSVAPSCISPVSRAKSGRLRVCHAGLGLVSCLLSCKISEGRRAAKRRHLHYSTQPPISSKSKSIETHSARFCARLSVCRLISLFSPLPFCSSSHLSDSR